MPAAGGPGYVPTMGKLWVRGSLRHLARPAGAALGGLFRAAGAVRPAAKPLHPRGDVVSATLTRRPADEPTGVAFLDTPGRDVVLVRRSRAAGLPAWLPDVQGLAVRVPRPDGGHGDLLLASTGLGTISRFLLVPARGRTRAMTTLLPYGTPTGPVLLAAVPLPTEGSGPEEYDMAWARPRGGWHRWARLTLGPAPGPEALLSFDPVTHPLPGLAHPAWVRRLREPAYRGARRSRR